MNDRIYMAISLIALLFVQGCAYNEMTYFRKYQATVTDERTDWGLCGGNFLPDGQVHPIVDTKILKCMLGKGYQSINDYYEEQQISFINLSDPTNIYISDSTLIPCGFQRTSKEVGGVCRHDAYILKSRLSRAITCMSARGYEATLPRYKSAFRIIENNRAPSPNFCLALTPTNRKGGVSFGGWRLE